MEVTAPLRLQSCTTFHTGWFYFLDLHVILWPWPSIVDLLT